jgi:hypothetical protein
MGSHIVVIFIGLREALMSKDLQPPEPEDFKRKIEFYPFQWVGIPLLFLIPILALFGVLGETETTAHATGTSLDVAITYSNHVNFQSTEISEISVTNTGDVAIPILTVAIEKAYLDNFSDKSFTPPIREITEGAYVIELADLQAGETRYITYDSRGATIGSHRGMVRFSSGEDEVSLTIETLIFP